MYPDNNLAKSMIVSEKIKEALERQDMEKIRDLRSSDAFNKDYDSTPCLGMLVDTILIK